MSGERRERGTVRVFHRDKAYGWVQTEAGRAVFVHATETQHRGLLTVGDVVAFTVVETERGPRAIDCVVLPAA